MDFLLSCGLRGWADLATLRRHNSYAGWGPGTLGLACAFALAFICLNVAVLVPVTFQHGMGILLSLRPMD